MATGEERLARTLIDILGEDKVLEIVGTERLADALAELDMEQQFSILHRLMPGLTEQELRDLLKRATLQPREGETTPQAQNK